MKRLAIASLVLSLLFAGLIVARWTREQPVVAVPSAGPSPALDAPAPRVITNVVTVVRTNTPTPAPPEFHWSQLESTNYVAYRDNLRDFGCPEWLVRQILFRDLVAQSRWNDAELGFPSREWKSAGTIQDEQRERARAVYENKMAVGRSMEELFGVFWLEEVVSGWVNDGEFMELFGGFLSEDMALETGSRLYALDAFKNRIEAGTGGILLESDRRALDANYGRTMDLLQSRLGHASVEELKARAGFVLAMFQMQMQPKYLDVSGPQLRELSRAVYEFTDPLRNEFVADEDVGAKLKAGRDEFVALIAERLGTGVAANVLRAGDPEFRETVDFAEQHHLRPSTRTLLYETQQALKGELERLRQRDAINPEDMREIKAVALELVEVTRRELGRVLTEKQIDEYLAGPAGLAEFVDREDAR